MNDEQKTDLVNAPAVRHDIKAGGEISGIIPSGIDEAFRLSRALAAGGDMVPKHFQNNEGMILAAILRGAELGLAPMQALSNIAVINGRASIWGDALPALMQRHGHQIDHEIKGEGDDRRAVATLIRGDTGQKIVREFSVADAKKAGLWTKTGPWQTYPERMLAMRARSWACRDGAADAMMGTAVVEEQQDAQPMRDVTPKEPPQTGYAEMARLAREKAAQAAREAAKAEPEPIDGEIVTDEPEVDPDIAAKMASEAFSAGVAAAADPDTSRSDNPYTDDPTLAAKWFSGFDQVREAETDDDNQDQSAGDEADDAGESAG